MKSCDWGGLECCTSTLPQSSLRRQRSGSDLHRCCDRCCVEVSAAVLIDRQVERVRTTRRIRARYRVPALPIASGRLAVDIVSEPGDRGEIAVLRQERELEAWPEVFGSYHAPSSAGLMPC